jgi:hypothetical protein
MMNNGDDENIFFMLSIVQGLIVLYYALIIELIRNEIKKLMPYNLSAKSGNKPFEITLQINH